MSNTDLALLRDANHDAPPVKPAALPAMGVLALAHCSFWGWGLGRGLQEGRLDAANGFAVATWLVGIAIWLVFVAKLSRSGWLLGPGVATHPWVWIPLPPLLLTLLGFVFVAALREAWLEALTLLPNIALPALMGLRILAIGTVIKAWQDHLPRRIGYGVGIPDLAFGLFSIGVALSGGFENSTTEIIWHLVGAAILIMMLPMVFTVLRPLRLDDPGKGSARAILAFPMILAPAGLATLFLVLHMLRLWQLAGA
jgi:hypothetical protein